MPAGLINTVIQIVCFIIVVFVIVWALKSLGLHF